jgi:CBS domain-containing protein
MLGGTLSSRQRGRVPSPPQPFCPARFFMTARALSTFRFPDGTCIAQAQPQAQRKVTLDSPARAVMTDLTEVRAATVHPGLSLAQAEQKMIHQGVRLLFAVTQMPCVDGIVTADALQGDKPLQLIQQRHVRRDELCVADVMTPLSALDVVDLQALERATVANVVATLRQFGRPHLVVVEAATADSSARIRGVISRTQIERQLGFALPMLEVASTFGEIKRALA